MRVTKLWKIGNSVVCTVDVQTLIESQMQVGELVSVSVPEKHCITIRRAKFDMKQPKPEKDK